jgi:hypothetical protein
MRKHPALLISAFAVLYIAMAAIFILAMPAARGPFEYLVAGAFATGVCLLAGFALYARAAFLRRNRRSS